MYFLTLLNGSLIQIDFVYAHMISQSCLILSTYDALVLSGTVHHDIFIHMYVLLNLI